MRTLSGMEVALIADGAGEGGDGFSQTYYMGDLVNDLRTEGVAGMSLGDTAVIAGVISAGAFSAAAIPGPSMVAFTFVGLTTAGLSALLTYIDTVNRRRS